MTKYVVSTLGTDVAYTGWVNNSGMNNVAHQVLVRGGAGVAGKTLVTRGGVRTELSEADAEFVKANSVFKFHQERGFVKIISIDRDPDSVARSMDKDKGSSPRVPEDVKEFAKKKGDETFQAVTNKSK